MKLSKKSFEWLRSCGHCTGAGLKVDLYCNHCWQQEVKPLMLDQRDPNFHFDHGLLKVSTLFRWGLSGEFIGRMIHQLKGGYHFSAFERLAESFSARRSALGLVEPFVIIPSPPQTEGDIDHAFLWAKALSEYWNAPMKALLTRSSSTRQKSLNAEARQTRRFKRLKNEQGVERNMKIIFADDVYTTGATARAAYEALGCPSGFEVWAVACRPKLFQV